MLEQKALDLLAEVEMEMQMYWAFKAILFALI